MRSPLNDRITEIQPSGIRKFFDIVTEMEDAISLGVGEPDFDTPWHVREEGIHSLEMGRTFYTSNAGLKELRTEISNYINRRFGVSYDPISECMVTIGGSEEFANRLLREQKVAIVPGTAFGDCGEGFMRISYAYSIDDLKKALDRIEAFVRTLPQVDTAQN